MRLLYGVVVGILIGLDPAAHRVRDILTRIAQPHEQVEQGLLEADALLDARKRVAAAVGEGSIAVAHVHRRLDELAIAAG